MFFHSPEELHQEIEKQQLLMRNDLHEFERFLMDMSLDQILSLKRVWHTSAHQNENNQFATYVDGVITGIAAVRFGVCSFCGVDHTKEAEAELVKGEPNE